MYFAGINLNDVRPRARSLSLSLSLFLFARRLTALYVLPMHAQGFGGGNNISQNLLFQTCGESGGKSHHHAGYRKSPLLLFQTMEPLIL